MSDAYYGEIRIMPYRYAPMYWASCDGQKVPISQFQALASILGTIYGGDGRSTFALPDLRGRMPLHVGNSRGPGLSPRILGKKGGETQVTLSESHLPSHTHQVYVDRAKGRKREPANRFVAADSQNPLYDPDPTTLVQMSSNALSPAGAGQSHNNLQPFLALNFCICLENADYPPRS